MTLYPSPNLDDLPINGSKDSVPKEHSQFMNSSPFQTTQYGVQVQPRGFISPVFGGGVVDANLNNCRPNNVYSSENEQSHQNANLSFHKNSHGNYRQNRQRNKVPKWIAHCDGCDRSFKTLEKKEEHFSQHVKCEEPGCEFEAHVKIVEKHWFNLHGPLAKKLNLNINEDDVEWRRQRKKNFPTKARIEEKMQIKLEREAKGAVLHHRNPKRLQKRNRYNKPSNELTFPMEMLENNKKQQEQRISDSSDRKVYEMSSNPMDLLAGEEEAENETKLNEKKSSTPIIKSCAPSGLMSLMAAYSDSDSDDSTSKVSTEKQKILTANKAPAVNSNTEKKMNSVKRQPTSPLNTESLLKRFRAGPTIKEHKQNARADSRKAFLSKQSLMQRLLASEITHEHNTILQCVRFIVNNNFFEDNDDGE